MRAITFGSSAISTASGRAACGQRARVGTISCILTLGELTWRLCNKPLGNSIGLPLVLRLQPTYSGLAAGAVYSQARQRRARALAV